MAVAQEPGPPHPDCLPLCGKVKVVFIVMGLSEGRPIGMSHCVCFMVWQTADDSCRQLHRESKLQKAVFSDSCPPDEPMAAQQVS